MVTIVNTITVQAMKAIPTEVQTSIYNGIPSFHIVGMVNKSVNESAIRIRTAINSLGFDMPAKKIVVNLSPTNIIKEGNYYDLPIAIGILFELEIIKNIDLKGPSYYSLYICAFEIPQLLTSFVCSEFCLLFG